MGNDFCGCKALFGEVKFKKLIPLKINYLLLKNTQNNPENQNAKDIKSPFQGQKEIPLTSDENKSDLPGLRAGNAKKFISNKGPDEKDNNESYFTKPTRDGNSFLYKSMVKYGSNYNTKSARGSNYASVRINIKLKYNINNKILIKLFFIECIYSSNGKINSTSRRKNYVQY